MSKVCPECDETFDASADVCPYDGSPLEAAGSGGERHIGTVIDDRFRIDDFLGQGGMGRVYEATQLSVDRRVAIKLIRAEGLQDPEIEQRFYREAQVISDFSHPNIVRLIDFGEDEALGVPYLVMEFIDGLVLSDLVEEHRLHPNFALEVAAQVAAGLVEAHEAEVVHRDLKTENILLVPISPGGFQAKIIDFGIAFPQQSAQNLTSTGAVCGTPQYLSPEQARGKEVGPASDLYSLGVILFEMTTGVKPFEASSAFDIMVKHVQQEPPPISKFLESSRIPQELEALVENLLEKQPADRPPSAREVRRAVDTIRSAAGWNALRIEEEGPLEEALEPWILSPADRGGRLVTEGVAVGPGTDSAPVPPDTDRAEAPEHPSTAPGSEAGGAASGQLSDETSEERERSKVPVQEGAGAAQSGAGGSGAGAGAAADVAGESAPGAPTSKRAATVGAETDVENQSQVDGSGDSKANARFLGGLTVALLAVLGLLGATLFALESGAEDEERADRTSATADAGAKGAPMAEAAGARAAGTGGESDAGAVPEGRAGAPPSAGGGDASGGRAIATPDGSSSAPAAEGRAREPERGSVTAESAGRSDSNDESGAANAGSATPTGGETESASGGATDSPSKGTVSADEQPPTEPPSEGPAESDPPEAGSDGSVEREPRGGSQKEPSGGGGEDESYEENVDWLTDE